MDRFGGSRTGLRSPRAFYDRLAALKARSDEDHVLLAEVDQRTLALSHQVDRLQEMIETLDPQGTRDIAVGVRDTVRELSVQLTEQANDTSRLLTDLARERG